MLSASDDGTRTDGDEHGRPLGPALVHREDGRVLGVHVIGDGAAELVHIGQTVMNFGGTIDYFVEPKDVEDARSNRLAFVSSVFPGQGR